MKSLYLCIEKKNDMNRRIKQVWLLAILSSFLLIGLQTYWLYNSVTYSMGEMGKKNAEKA